MAITNTQIFGNHLDKDVDDIFFDEYTNAPTEYDKVAKIQSAPAGNHYTESELSPLGELREIPEGTGVQFDLPEEGHKKTIYYTKYGLGFQITEEMMKDDLFGNFKRMPSKLAKSASIKPDLEFWDLFNNGFATHQSWDSNYIFHTGHTTLKSGDTIGNEPSTASSLSDTTLQAAFEYYDTLVDEAGNPLTIRPNKLIVPTELKYTALKLRANTGQIGTANNDLNIVGVDNDFVDSYSIHVSRFLTSSTAWFLLSDQHDFRLFWKDKARLESADDFYTGNALFKVIMRFATFVMDYKGAYGNSGA
jgi:phage major head subunit gpT-like protein